jgi:hypothetical protein
MNLRGTSELLHLLLPVIAVSLDIPEYENSKQPPKVLNQLPFEASSRQTSLVQ